MFVCGRCWVDDVQHCTACAPDVSRAAIPAAKATSPSRPAAAPQKGVILPPPKEDGLRGSATRSVNQAPAPAVEVRALTTLAGKRPVLSGTLEPVGPGVSDVEAEAPPRWARSGPVPVTVRGINVLTEGTAYRVALAILLAVGISAAVWGIMVTNNDQSRAGQVPVQTDVGATGSRTPAPTPTLGPERRYIVRDGDTLTAIAQQVYNDANLWTVILEANRDKIPDPDNLRIRTDLVIPNP